MNINTNEDKNIRYAELNDFHGINEIADQAQHYHVELRPDMYKETPDGILISKEKYLELINNKKIIVYCEKQKVKGYIIIEDKKIENPFMKKQKILFIDSLAVAKEVKQQGIGKNLMKYIEKYAKDNKYEKIELQVNGKNEVAKALYYNQGFTTKSINLEYYI